jgi:exodeoxyribonuclease V alpha subunit
LVTYHSDATGYTVCSVRPVGAASDVNPVTVVGNCAAVWVGEEMRAKGRWVRHAQHGMQFQAESITCIAPTSMEGIRRYLSSGMIRGIGKVNAKRIVDFFGEKTLDVIDKESIRLEEVEGIGPVRRKLIKESWNEQRGVRDIMIFLQSNGVGTGQSARIYRVYGQDAIALVKQNPYRLCRDIWGIGFKTADAIAMRVGIPRDSAVRARAGLLYTLQTQTDEGHCFGIEADLLLQAQALLDITVEILADALHEELAAGALVKSGDRIYLAHLAKAEEHVAAKLRRLLDTPPSFRPIEADKAVPWAATKIGIDLAPMQRKALEMALASKVSIMTGGPGVGKTTIIRALVEIFGIRKLAVRLAAPTGRAARRMSEATGGDAQTLHRLLKYNPQFHRFEHNADSPLPGDVFIVDEASMIDLPLADDFLSALPDSAHVVFVGDTDQLPSVGPGNVLRDLIASEAIPCTRLDTIFRQQKGGYIVRNAHRINQGERFETAERGEDSDFFFVPCDDPDQTIAKVVELVTQRIPRKFGFTALTDIQVLTPMRRNQLGSENLNQILQEALNPTGPSVQRLGRTYRVGDRVMQLRNNYDKDVFNGDIGFIRALDADAQTLEVDFDGRGVRYEFSELDELVHAFACSIHKSQGSEYPAVVIVLATQHFKLLQRNLLYTALTRGKKLVCLVGSHKAVGIAIANNDIRERRTALAERLRQ